MIIQPTAGQGDQLILGVNYFETYPKGPKKGYFTQETLDAREKYYADLHSRLESLKPVKYVVEVAEVLYKDAFPLDAKDSEVIIQDTEGRLFSLTEQSYGHMSGLTSRHNVRVGTILRMSAGPINKDEVTIVRVEFIKMIEAAREGCCELII